MPLPDERPRQSVANLIGKFETQTKRLSLSASSPSRSSSVVSHITGDSAKEEVKEKREWPPKSVTEAAAKQHPIVPSSFSRYVPAPLITSSTSTATGDNKNASQSGPDVGEIEVPLTAKALNASQRQVNPEPNIFLENWRKDIPPAQVDMEPEPAPATAKPETTQEEPNMATPTLASSKEAPAPPRTPSGTKTTGARATPLATSKSAASTPVRTPAKSVLKSTPSRQSLSAAAVQPLKPQHTGQSVASSATTKRPIAKPPPTPSSAKVARTDAARAKTPTLTRPKTPSSGLFAPTAASLAKSRNAPPVPPPVKKAHVSSSSLDRLSKPTAASQARMNAAATTARAAVATPRTPAAKAKVPPSPKVTKKASTTTRAPIGAAATATGVAVVAVADPAVAPAEAAKEVAEESGNGHIPSTMEAANAYEETEVPAEEEVHVEEENVSGEDHEATPRSPSPAHVEPEVVEPEAEETAPEVEDVPAVATKGDDLADIVNLLESVSISKPSSDTTADISEEILEIPDEDEK